MPVGRLEADNAAKGGGLPQGTARICPDRSDGEVSSNGCRRAARRAAGHDLGAIASHIRVDRWSVHALLGGRTHAELVHVGLAKENSAGIEQFLGDERLIGGHEIAEDLRPRRREDAGRTEIVLHGNREPVEWQCLVFLASLVRILCALKGFVMHQRDVRVQVLFLFNALEIGFDFTLDGHIAGQEFRRFGFRHGNSARWK